MFIVLLVVLLYASTFVHALHYHALYQCNTWFAAIYRISAVPFQLLKYFLPICSLLLLFVVYFKDAVTVVYLKTLSTSQKTTFLMTGIQNAELSQCQLMVTILTSFTFAYL